MLRLVRGVGQSVEFQLGEMTGGEMMTGTVVVTRIEGNEVELAFSLPRRLRVVRSELLARESMRRGEQDHG